MKTLILTLTALTLAPQWANANAKVVGNAGDAARIRRTVLDRKKPELKKKLAAAIHSNLPGSLKQALSSMTDARVKLADEQANEMLSAMREENLWQDIQDTPVVASAECLDNVGIARSATTAVGKKAAPICADLDRIIEEYGPYIQDSDLVALFLHELAHHYGYADSDYRFAAAVADYYQSEAERLNRDGDPLNYILN